MNIKEEANRSHQKKTSSQARVTGTRAALCGSLTREDVHFVQELELLGEIPMACST